MFNHISRNYFPEGLFQKTQIVSVNLILKILQTDKNRNKWIKVFKIINTRYFILLQKYRHVSKYVANKKSFFFPN